MKISFFSFRTELRTTNPVNSHSFILKCIPQDTSYQKISDLNFLIEPCCASWRSTDFLGNITAPGYIETKHDRFVFDVSGYAAIDRSFFDESQPHPLFKRFTRLTQPGQSIERLFGSLTLSHDPETRINQLTEAAAASIEYRYGHTSFMSTAEEALSSGFGVCQDYAHILISLCRLAGLPARYVSGLMSGEGASHAWVDIYDGIRWRGVDPTNLCCVNDNYIEISHGRDYTDCSPERGVFRGACSQSLNITASVWDAVSEKE